MAEITPKEDRTKNVAHCRFSGRGFLVLFFLLIVAVPTAQAEEVQIDATKIFYDKAKNVYLYEDARLTFRTLSVDAKHIEYTPEQNRVVASGQVYFREKTLSGSAEKIELNLADDTGVLYKAWLYDLKNGYRLEAETVDRLGAERFVAYGCSVTTCKPDQPGWTLEVSELDFRLNNFATGSHMVLNLGPVPVFYSPWVAFPTVNRRTTGFLAPRFSQTTSSRQRFHLGTRLRIPFFWALDVDHDLTLEPEWIEHRGIALRGDYNYAFTEDFEGKFSWFGIPETKERNLNEELVPADVTDAKAGGHQRYFIDWRHNQKIGQQSRLTLEVATTSDGQVRREYFGTQRYRPRLDYEAGYSFQHSWIDSVLVASHTSEYTLESIFANDEAHSDGRLRPKLLPEISFATGGMFHTGLPLAGNLSGKIVQFQTKTGLSGQAKEITPKLSLPLSLGGSWELRPQIARRLVAFEELTFRAPGEPETAVPDTDFAQDLYEVELRTAFARTFSGNNGELNLKHRFTPRLIFQQKQDVEQPLAGSLGLAESLSLTSETETYKAGIIPESYTEKLAIFRVDNEWLLGNERFQSPLAHLNIIQRYNMLLEEKDFSPIGPAPNLQGQETLPGFPILPLIIEGSIIQPRLTTSAALHYHHQLNVFNERSISLSGRAASYATFGVTYSDNLFTYRLPDNRTVPSGRSLQFSGSGRLSETLSTGFSGQVNLNDGPSPLNRRLVSSGLNLVYLPGCYSIRADYSELVGVAEFEGEIDYYVDKTLLITFDLGGLISARSVSSLEQ